MSSQSICNEILNGATSVLSLYAVVSPLGIVLNLLCIVSIAQVLWANRRESMGGNMFAYFLAKAVSDCVFFVINIFWVWYQCSQIGLCTPLMWRTDFYAYWSLIGLDDIADMALVFSVLMEAFAIVGKE